MASLLWGIQSTEMLQPVCSRSLKLLGVLRARLVLCRSPANTALVLHDLPSPPGKPSRASMGSPLSECSLLQKRVPGSI